MEGIFAIGRAQLSKTILNESNPVGSSRLSKLRHIFEEGKSLQLQFPAEDLGFRYITINYIVTLQFFFKVLKLITLNLCLVYVSILHVHLNDMIKHFRTPV